MWEIKAIKTGIILWIVDIKAEFFYYVNYGSGLSIILLLVFITEIILRTFDVIIDDP